MTLLYNKVAYLNQNYPRRLECVRCSECPTPIDIVVQNVASGNTITALSITNNTSCSSAKMCGPVSEICGGRKAIKKWIAGTTSGISKTKVRRSPKKCRVRSVNQTICDGCGGCDRCC